MHYFRAKRGSPTILGDYRPIAWCGVRYKCITKIIIARMRVFMQEVISLNQSAFIVGRRIQDNILLAHELLHNYHREEGRQRLVVKVDLRKAYDFVR